MRFRKRDRREAEPLGELATRIARLGVLAVLSGEEEAMQAIVHLGRK
jgi:hypothetical protein